MYGYYGYILGAPDIPYELRWFEGGDAIEIIGLNDCDCGCAKEVQRKDILRLIALLQAVPEHDDA